MEILRRITRKIKNHTKTAICGGVSILAVLGGYVWALIALRGSQATLILHFNNLSGINQYGGMSQIVFWGLFGLLAVSVNTLLALELADRERFLSKMVSAATVAFAALLFIAFAAIIGVN